VGLGSEHEEISRPPAAFLRLFVTKPATRLPIPAALLLSLATLLLPGTAALGKAFDTEDDFVRYLQQQLGGEIEVTLPDRTRVDLLTRNHAFEVDRARKWPQAIGQSLHYARMTDRRPAIVLLSRAEDGGRYFRRIVGVIESFELPILLMLLDVETLRLSRVDLDPSVN
jgi:hypothetical protein